MKLITLQMINEFKIKKLGFDMMGYTFNIDENIKGKLDIDNLKRIRDILLCFEKEHSGARTKKGHPLIKEQYIRNRIKLG